jgi:hypothetical protein
MAIMTQKFEGYMKEAEDGLNKLNAFMASESYQNAVLDYEAYDAESNEMRDKISKMLLTPGFKPESSETLQDGTECKYENGDVRNGAYGDAIVIGKSHRFSDYYWVWFNNYVTCAHVKYLK